MVNTATDLPAIWLTEAAGPEQKASLQGTLKSSRTALKTLRNLLRRRLESLEMDEVSWRKLHNFPSWGFRQAHLNGKRDAFRETIALLQWVDQP